jgi:hypothetical protein
VSARTLRVWAAALVWSLTAAPSALAAYGIGFDETLSTGAAAASPDLTLRVAVAPGSEATARIVAHIDPGHFGPGGMRPMLEGLALAGRGTPIGSAAITFAGVAQMQMAVRMNTALPGAGADSPVLTGSLEPAPDPGASTPIRIEAGPAGDLAISADLRPLRAALVAAGAATGVLQEFELRLFGTYTGGQTEGRIALNPANRQTLRTTVEAFPCADAACTSEAAAMSASASITLPKRITFTAPPRFVYGQRTLFTGTGDAGDVARLWLKTPGGLVPVPAPGAIVGRDGRFSITARPRTIVDAAGTVLHRATGRYVVTVAEGGTGAIAAEATGVSRASLGSPRLRILPRAGRQLEIAVSLPGGDATVSVRVTRGSVLVARGVLDRRGRFATTLRVGAVGRYRAVVSLPGATSARSNSVTVGPARR